MIRTGKEEPLTQPASLVWRLPIIRHIRYIVQTIKVNRWYGVWRNFGYLENSNFDRKVLEQIWRGIV